MRSVRFISNGEQAYGSKLLDMETNIELRGVRRIVAIAEVDNINVIEAEFICASIEIQGQFVPMFVHPETGKVERVKRIEFADGSAWSV